MLPITHYRLSNDGQFMSGKRFDLTGQVAVVIGATGVLGGALAEGLAAAGASVVVVGRNHERGERCVQKIRERGGQATFVAADATSRPSLHAAQVQVEKDVGPVSVLLNAAGGNDPKVTVTGENSFEKIAIADWQASFDLNLAGGVLLPCQEFGAAMVSRGRGSIINIASVSGHIPLSRS